MAVQVRLIERSWPSSVTTGADVGAPAQPLLLAGRGRAMDLVPLEGGPDGRHVRRAVAEVAVVVVGGEHREVAAGGGAAAADRAGVPVADGLRADVEEPRGDLVRRLRVVVEGGIEQVPRHEVPARLGRDVALAVRLAAAGAGGALGAGIPERRPDPAHWPSVKPFRIQLMVCGASQRWFMKSMSRTPVQPVAGVPSQASP